MPIGYGTNIDALRAVRLSGKSGQQLGETYNQLSSGLRINRTSVDPAGQAVANVLGVNARVLSRARLNIDDGISQLSATDGAYQTTSDLLFRMQELAEQSANGALSASQRNSLDAEFSQLRSELQRLQEGAQFNGNRIARGGPTARAATQFKTTAGETAISNDGRIATYLDGTNLRQRDLVTGETRTIASNISLFSADATGTTVAYVSGDAASVYTYDRTTGASTNRFSANSISAVELSADGSTVAVLASESFHDDGSGTSLGDDGYLHLSSYTLAGGILRGDRLQHQFVDGVEYLTISPDGSQVALKGSNDAVGTSDTFIFLASDPKSIHYQLNSGYQEAIIGFDTSNRLYLTTTENLGSVNSSGKSNVLRTSDGTSFENLTRLTTGNGVEAAFMTDSGTSFAFLAATNPTGENTTGVRQLFKQSLTGDVRQLTNRSSALATSITLSGDGFTVIDSDGSTTSLIDVRPEYTTTVSTGTGARGTISTGAMSLDGIARGLNDLDISTANGGRSALDSLRNSLNQLTLARSSVGAGLSRLESARRVTDGAFTQTDTARARITDVDIADAVAQSTRLEILRDTQAAVLAQASRLMPQIALSLLQ